VANWERLAEQSQGMYEPADYERAGYRLMVDQVIYANDRGVHRTAYDLLVKHASIYRDLFDQLGMEFKHNDFHSFVVLLPRHNVASKMKLAETRFALVLRRLYDDKMNAAEIVAGEALVGLEELERAFKELLGREMPERVALKELVATMKGYGIAREDIATDDQPFEVAIRPAIVEILGETALLQLAAHAPEISLEDADETA
jgi:Domain of unknown function (DUF4194)